MVSRRNPSPLPSHRYITGARLDAPLLLPLATDRAEIAALIRFCRRVCPGGPVLAPEPSEDKDPRRLATFIRNALPIYGLTLVPAVVVGHAEGADLAVRLTQQCGALLAAAVVLRPTVDAPELASGSLVGLSVLLVRSADEEAIGTAGWQVRNALLRAGAQVICERGTRRGMAGGKDMTIVRVFLATLWGG